MGTGRGSTGCVHGFSEPWAQPPDTASQLQQVLTNGSPSTALVPLPRARWSWTAPAAADPGPLPDLGARALAASSDTTPATKSRRICPCCPCPVLPLRHALALVSASGPKSVTHPATPPHLHPAPRNAPLTPHMQYRGPRENRTNPPCPHRTGPTSGGPPLPPHLPQTHLAPAPSTLPSSRPRSYQPAAAAPCLCGH